MSPYSSLTGYIIPESVNWPKQEVAFHALLSSHSYFYNDQPIVFDAVLTNVGGYFYPGNGLFVCPDNNLYVFMWSIAVEGEASARLMSGVDELKFGPSANTGPQQDGSSSALNT